MKDRLKPISIGLKIKKGVHEVFLIAGGGSSRTWARRYRNMIQEYEYMKKSATNKEKRDQLKGYEQCMLNFYTAKGLNSVLDK